MIFVVLLSPFRHMLEQSLKLGMATSFYILSNSLLPAIIFLNAIWSKLLTASLNDEPKHKKLPTDRMIMADHYN